MGKVHVSSMDIPPGEDSGRGNKRVSLEAMKQRCFIIGYGNSMFEGSDFDGYKVVLGNGEIYASRNVM